MSKSSKAKRHLSELEIKGKIKTTIGFWRVQKWLIIYNAFLFSMNASEIAKHLAVSESLVHKTISEYNRYGVSAIETIGKGGRRHSYLTYQEEIVFLSGFIAKAQKGYIATVNEIKESYEQLIGKVVHKTTIYRLLDRHDWRKIVPLPIHPNQNKEEQESFKKTLKTT